MWSIFIFGLCKWFDKKKMMRFFCFEGIINVGRGGGWE